LEDLMVAPVAGVAGVAGVGTDLVEVADLRAALGRRPGLRTRLFCDGEWAHAHRHRDPLPHLAARLAAKEATMKALGVGMSSVAFCEIEVARDRSGRPQLRLHGRAAALAARLGVQRCELSLTHTRSLAQAVVVAVAGDAPAVSGGAP
jgi:holo-[acyl-carrier protein] synthase